MIASPEGRPEPRKPEGWRQHEVIDSTELASILGYGSSETIRAYLASATARRLLPPPAGKVGRVHFWWRAEVDSWIEANPIPPRRRSGAPKRRGRGELR